MSDPVPNFGTDLAPTDDMIARGRVGNGSYQDGDKGPDLEFIRAEKRRLAIQRKEERRAEYEARVVEDLGNIADFQSAMVKLGKKTALAALKGDELDKIDMDIIAKALKASDQISNRVLGLASRLDDKAPKQDGLGWLIEGQSGQ